MAVIKYSTDETSWSTATFSLSPDAAGNLWVSSSIYTGNVSSIFNSNNVWHVLLDNGIAFTNSQISQNLGSFTAQYSNKGLTWTTIKNGVGQRLQSVAYGNGIFVGVGEGIIYTSTSGETWNTGIYLEPSSTLFTSIDYGNGIWVAATSNGKAYRSTDATSWTSVNTTFGSTYISKVVYGNGTWLMGLALQGRTAISTNGITWTTGSLSNKTRSIAYGNGTWVAIDNSLVFKSTNATTWSSNLFTPAFSLNEVAYGNGKWVITGIATSQSYTSTDTISWTTINLNFGTTTEKRVFYADGLWIAAENSTNLSFSTDAVTWTTRTVFPSSVMPLTFGYGNGTYIFGVASNSVYSSLFSKNSGAYPANSKIYPFQSGLLKINKNSNLVDYVLNSVVSSSFRPYWTTQQTPSGLTSIRDIKYGNTGWVAIGNTQVSTSTNGSTWVSRVSNFTGARSLAYGNGNWVVGGDSGMIRYSTDSITWTTVTSNFTGSGIYKVSYGNGVWVAAGGLGAAVRSTNGSTWTTVDINLISSISLNLVSAAYGNGIWMLTTGIDPTNSSYSRVASSTNGINWTTTVTTLWSTSKEIAYGNGLWVAITTNTFPKISTNGTTWEEKNLSRQTTGVAYGNSRWVITGVDGYIATSTNGATWTSVTSNFDNYWAGTIGDVAYGNGIWMAVGVYAEARSSTNGTTWTTITSPLPRDYFSNSLSSIAYGNGRWVVGSWSGSIRTSTDNGSTWTTVTSNFGTSIRSIAYGNGVWVASSVSGNMRTSTNGTTWTTVTSNFGGTEITYVSYGNGLWVAVGPNGTNATSTNGSSWVTRSQVAFTGAAEVGDLSYGNGIWVVAGNSGTMSRSTDGLTWVAVTSTVPASSYISSVAYGGGLWICYATGKSYVSTDGLTWTTITEIFDSTTINRRISYENGQWYAIGMQNVGSIYRMWNSTNGIVWSTLALNTAAGQVHSNVAGDGNQTLFYGLENGQFRVSTNKIRSITGFNSYLSNGTDNTILGNQGIILRYNSTYNTWDFTDTGISDNFINGSVNSSGIYHIVGTNGLYYSTNLTNWTTLASPSASVINDIIAK